MAIAVEQLNQWADVLDRQISAIDKQISSLQEKRNELQSKKAAVDCLTGSGRNRQGTKPVPSRLTSVRSSLAGQRVHAPQSAYRMPILEVLVEIGGKGHVEEILPKVRLKMELLELLRQEDYGDVPSGGEEYWRNLARLSLIHI